MADGPPTEAKNIEPDIVLQRPPRRKVDEVLVLTTPDGHILGGQQNLREKLQALLDEEELAPGVKCNKNFSKPRTLRFCHHRNASTIARVPNVNSLQFTVSAEGGNLKDIHVVSAKNGNDNVSLPPLPDNGELSHDVARGALEQMTHTASLVSAKRNVEVAEAKRVPDEVEEALVGLIKILVGVEGTKSGFGHFFQKKLESGEKPVKPSTLFATAMSPNHNNENLRAAVFEFLVGLTDPEKSKKLGPENLVNVCRAWAEKLLGMDTEEEAAGQIGGGRAASPIDDAIAKIGLEATQGNRTSRTSGLRQFREKIMPAVRGIQNESSNHEAEQRRLGRIGVLGDGIEVVLKSDLVRNLPRSERLVVEQQLREANQVLDKKRPEKH
jgi:hypothetical protein